MSQSHVASLRELLIAAFSSPPLLAGMSVPPLDYSHNQYPWIIGQEINGSELESMDGRSGLVSTVIQLSVYDKQYERAWAMRQEVKWFLLGYKGSAGDGTIASTNHVGDRELYDGPNKLHQIITSFHIWWEADA